MVALLSPVLYQLAFCIRFCQRRSRLFNCLPLLTGLSIAYSENEDLSITYLRLSQIILVQQ